MSDELKFAIETVKGAEEILLKHLKAQDLNTKQKTDGSPVTVADKEAEDYIVSKIKAKYPTHSIYGEETGQTNNDSDYMWIIDPIDGTKNYTRGVPFFGTLLALMHNGKVILGVSNIPLLKEMLYAEQGSGAFCNGEQVQVSNITELSKAYVCSGALHYFDNLGIKQKVVDLRTGVFQHRIFGDLYSYHLLSRGKIDAVIEGSIKIYDIAPFSIILKESGGYSSQIDNKPINLNTTNYLATANPQIHQQILQYLS